MHCKLRSFLVFALALWVTLNPGTAQPLQAPAELQGSIQQIEMMVALELAKENVGSVTVGIVSGEELVWTRSFGYSDPENQKLATADSVYRIGSITKQFTGFMLLQLAERGRVKLSDPVEKYFPEIEQVRDRISGSPPITLIQLATMTSGLAREPEDLPTFLKGPVSEWENVVISALPRVKYDFEPDTRYQYSNIGYAILGLALGRAAGQSYIDYVRENLLLPLGMEHTAFEPNPAIQDSITLGHQILRDGTVDTETPTREHQGRGYKVPNGAMYTNVRDLARFLVFELGHGPESVLKKETLKENFTRVNSSNGQLTSGYGIGFRASRLDNLVFYGHGGSVAGYRASALFDPISDSGIIVLRNVGGRFNVGELARRALVVVAQSKSPSAPIPK